MANIDLYQRTPSDARADRQPAASAPFSDTHADLLDMFERWEVLADAGSEPSMDEAVRVHLSSIVLL